VSAFAARAARIMIENFPDVLARARTGDPEALATVYRALNPGLERYLRGRAPEAAEDIAAETWIAVAESIGRFRGDEADFRGWVFTIARNRVIDAHRKDRRRPESTELEADDEREAEGAGHGASDAAEDTALDALETEAVLELVRRLPPDQADVIMLRVVAGLDTERVAAVLGKRPGTIRVLQHRGLRNLERLLGDRSGESGAES
jgi:RNA polymerase sigma-70 factor (ECF subfamily)